MSDDDPEAPSSSLYIGISIAIVMLVGGCIVAWWFLKKGKAPPSPSGTYPEYVYHNSKEGKLMWRPDSDGEVKIEYVDGTTSENVNMSQLTKSSKSAYSKATKAAAVFEDAAKRAVYTGDQRGSHEYRDLCNYLQRGAALDGEKFAAWLADRPRVLKEHDAGGYAGDCPLVVALNRKTPASVVRAILESAPSSISRKSVAIAKFGREKRMAQQTDQNGVGPEAKVQGLNCLTVALHPYFRDEAARKSMFGFETSNTSCRYARVDGAIQSIWEVFLARPDAALERLPGQNYPLDTSFVDSGTAPSLAHVRFPNSFRSAAYDQLQIKATAAQIDVLYPTANLRQASELLHILANAISMRQFASHAGAKPPDTIILGRLAILNVKYTGNFGKAQKIVAANSPWIPGTAGMTDTIFMDTLSTGDLKKTASTVASTFEKMASAITKDSDSPLSVRLKPIKDALNSSLQNDLLCASPSLRYSAPVAVVAYTAAFIEPVACVVLAEIKALEQAVKKDPAHYIHVLESLAKDDKQTYDLQFNKSSNLPLGDPNQYQQLVNQIEKMVSTCELAKVAEQPTGPGLAELVLAVRERIPAYKGMVTKLVTAAKNGAKLEFASEADGDIEVIYRPGDQTKSPYRMVEKALLKGPNRKKVDCSQILDVFGCIINCKSYGGLAAVVRAATSMHNEAHGKSEFSAGGPMLLSTDWARVEGPNGSVFYVNHSTKSTSWTLPAEAPLRICRIKDRWAGPSGGGWRDLMLNVVVGGVVFEIQVVLTSMLNARKAMDAHASYNRFRCFWEVFGLLGDMPTLDLGGGGGADIAAAAKAAAQKSKRRSLKKVKSMEAQVAMLKAENARLKGGSVTSNEDEDEANGFSDSDDEDEATGFSDSDE